MVWRARYLRQLSTCKLSSVCSGLEMQKILLLMISTSLSFPDPASTESSWPLALASANTSLTVAFLRWRQLGLFHLTLELGTNLFG